MKPILDEKQQEVIYHLKNGESYILVEAPAGTGKTYCCIQAAKTLCDNNMLQPFEKVLILTFSRNARAQLLKELSKIPRESPIHKQIDINNYHSFFKKYLDVYRDVLRIKKSLTVLDDDDFVLYLYSYATDKKIQLIKGLGVEIIDDYCLDNGNLILINSESKHKKIAKEEKTKFLNCASEFTRETGYVCFAQFGNLTCDILNSSTHMARAISHDYPVIILDEYQDTNYYQYEFISKVLANSKGIFFADKWQMIYGFRGSSTERLSELFTKYPAIKKVTFNEYHRYDGKQDIINILNSIRNGQSPDYSALRNGAMLISHVQCENNWQVLQGKAHKAQCTSFSKSIFYTTVKEIIKLLSQNKSIAVLCRHNEVANKLSEIFFEQNMNPRSISDSPDMIRLCKNLKRCLEEVPLKQKVGSILVIAALCTMNKKIDKEDSNSLQLIDYNSLSKKHKPMLKQIFSIIVPYADKTDAESSLCVISLIMKLLISQQSIIINYSRQRFIEHCLKVTNLTPAIADRIMMQRQYIDSFTNISPGLYITTVHQAKGKEFDCVFIVDITDIEKEPTLMYVANSRMKERLYPIKVQYTGLPY